MKKVLVAEDESSIREFVVINLKRNGYDVVEAADGAQAIEKYKACNGDIDVAILDIMMPYVDGLEVCKQLRAMNANLGIIMMTMSQSRFRLLNSWLASMCSIAA